jgi:hypothetical protein
MGGAGGGGHQPGGRAPQVHRQGGVRGNGLTEIEELIHLQKARGVGRRIGQRHGGGILEIRIRSDPVLLSVWIRNFQHLFQIRIRT